MFVAPLESFSPLNNKLIFTSINCIKASQSYSAIATNTVENNVTRTLVSNNLGATLFSIQDLIILTKGTIMKLVNSKPENDQFVVIIELAVKFLYDCIFLNTQSKRNKNLRTFCYLANNEINICTVTQR